MVGSDGAVSASPHPVWLLVEDDLRRSRLTVFFRLLLAIPHLIWVTLWSIAVFFVAIANWLFALAAGRPAARLHRFLVRYVRYSLHLDAYLSILANPYPEFTGEESKLGAAYPIDVELPEPAPQSRWGVLLRVVLALPALFLSTFLGGPSLESPGTHRRTARLPSTTRVPTSALSSASARCSAGLRASPRDECRVGCVTRAPTRSGTEHRCLRTCC